MTYVRLTMAQALIKFLDSQYLFVDGQEHKFVEGIFAIFGHGNVTGLGEALEYSQHNLKFIRGNNEQGMVHAATAFAKQNNRTKIYAVTSSIGPGATNLVTGAATATINKIPVLLLPGDIFASRGPDPVLQQLEHSNSHEITVNDCLKPVSKYFDRINRPEQLMSALLKAFNVLCDPALTGAVTLCLPQDVQCESYDYPADFFKKRIHRLDRRLPDEDVIERAAQLILKSERPLIIAGGGIHYSHASYELHAFAHEFNIPIAETQSGKGTMLHDAEMNVGGVGVLGTSSANQLAQTADCVVAIGTRLADFVTSSKTAFSDHCRIISINVDSFDSMKLEPTFAIVADAKIALIKLAFKLRLASYKTSSSYQNVITEKKAAWLFLRQKLLDGPFETNGLLNQAHALVCLNDHCADNAVVVAAAGSLPGDLQRLWQVRSIKGYHLEYGYSCMGYEIAGGLGVKMAQPEREVWVVLGDGSFLMMHSEIVTARQEDLKINILLLDSGGFNCIKSLQCAHGSLGFGTDLRFRDQETKELTGDLIPIDYAQYASALGLKTYKASTIEQLKQHILSSRAESVSTLIEIKIAQGSQTNGYDTWWNVPISEVSSCHDVARSHELMINKALTARRY